MHARINPDFSCFVNLEQPLSCAHLFPNSTSILIGLLGNGHIAHSRLFACFINIRGEICDPLLYYVIKFDWINLFSNAK